MSIYWGVYPTYFECEREINEEVLGKIDKILIEKTSLSPGYNIIITGSIPYIITGKTNFIRLHQVGSTYTMY